MIEKDLMVLFTKAYVAVGLYGFLFWLGHFEFSLNRDISLISLRMVLPRLEKSLPTL
jgi:hypothetical protein